MHTTTSKTVLSPLAEAVSSLIVIVSDAETEGTPMPDLSALASGVESQIANLVSVGKKIQDQPSADEIMKRDMPLACEGVTKAAALLVESTQGLVSDPYSQSGRQGLLDAVKGILSGTTQVLNVFDDAEVRKILSACTLLRNLLYTITLGPPSPTDAQSYVQTIAQASQTIVVLAQLTNKRVAELLYPVLQTRLKTAIVALTKQSPGLIGVCKLCLMHPGKEGTKNARKETCERLVDVVKEIEVVVQFTTEEEGLAMEIGEVGKLRKALAEEYVPKIFRGLQSGSTQDVHGAITEQSDAIGAIIQHAQDQIKGLKDPLQKAACETLVTELTNSETRLQKALKDYSAKPTPETERALRTALDNLTARTEALQTGLNKSIVSEAGSVIANVGSTTQPGTLLTHIHESAKKGDTKAVQEGLERFEGESAKLYALATTAMDTVCRTHPQLAQELKVARDRLKGLTSGLKGATELLVANPADAATQEHYKAVVAAWEDGVKDVQRLMVGQEGVFKAHELVSGAKNGFEHHARALAAVASKGDIRSTHQEAALLVSAAHQFVAVARKEAENTEDAGYRKELDAKIKQVETILPQLLSGAELVLNSLTASSLDAALELGSIVRDLASHLTGLGDVIRNYKGGNELIEDTNTQESEPQEETNVKSAKHALDELVETLQDVVIVEEEKPVLLSEEEAKAEPIKAAGQELKVEASNWTSTQNPIVHAVTIMSQNLLDLSALHTQLRTSAQPATKKAFIASAQQITSQAMTVSQSARPIIEACTDRRLRAQLLACSDKIQTLGQQLKIVAAVKASAPMDRDRDAQLVACAANLMGAVKGCLRDCESASLRISPSVLERIGVRFRRQLYRAKQFGQ
ncbi:uncharacterized protein SPPG_03801 [Spizellomyces punctatus DAOM BR117]|uniref:Uncharacterized protein n=1 Tax=Spizellomyces punctatus (strain DAOM BR117) TaxID=645134 RepID=A0A0L0HHW5_SPIPD|nr:uncharacterized protein SPPG_03801 [Spizellomyces punctatus DAOM BR117]KND00678.1 hypothetical protein SPPG_03801 [Spizellomyces punctatus DAOM BR117]|eukprot:XP_016608717.1 hypothetical protein SPPG_03801 [Spizellomyces punctatus DAOM BR117]